MKGRGLTALGFVLIASLIAASFAAAKVQTGGGRASRTLAASGCQLNSVGDKIKHVVYLQFDNTHYSAITRPSRPIWSRCRTCSTS